MTEQFKQQGGVSSSKPSKISRWLISRFLTRLVSQRRLKAKREQAESKRKQAGATHRVEYFHQIDDAYSHLTAQILKSLAQRYDVELVCHLVNGPADNNLPEPDLLLSLSRRDAFHVAPEYGLEFAQHDQPLSSELITKAAAILAAQDSKSFIDCIVAVSSAMWAGNVSELTQLAEQYGTVSHQIAQQKIIDGTQRQTTLKHYSGAMFYYAGEWYWGVDRLYHLEKRLAGLGVDRNLDQPLLIDRPAIEVGQLKESASLTLEIFPSLRSPYSAICFDRAVKLATDSGVKLEVRPVLPMVMRGVPATREKGMYIFTDAAREAKSAGTSFGNFYDPIGEPVLKTYSLYPWAQEQGKSVELISSFLSCAFAQGINTNRDSGLKKVVQQAGLDWPTAKKLIGTAGWEPILEKNRLAMYKEGLWGVPSFRLLDADGKQIIAVWGQDRLWLLAREIQRELAKD